jgi:hypothetical protein
MRETVATETPLAEAISTIVVLANFARVATWRLLLLASGLGKARGSDYSG